MFNKPVIVESRETQFADAKIQVLTSGPLKWIVERQPSIRLPLGILALNAIPK